MREIRYMYLGNIPLLILVINLLLAGLMPEFVSLLSNIDAATGQEDILSLTVAIFLAIIISPAFGYLIFTIIYSFFLMKGGYDGFYERNGITPLINQHITFPPTRFFDVSASYLYYSDESKMGYSEWIRRRLDNYFLSTSICLVMILTNIIFLLIIQLNCLSISIRSIIFIIVIWGGLFGLQLYIALNERNKAIDGLKLFFNNYNLPINPKDNEQMDTPDDSRDETNQ